nr:hypothetical protein [Vibrio cholerae]
MLQRLEQGERVVDIAQIRRLSAALGMDVQQYDHGQYFLDNL